MGSEAYAQNDAVKDDRDRVVAPQGSENEVLVEKSSKQSSSREENDNRVLKPRVRYVGAPNGLSDKFVILSALEKKGATFPTATALRRAARRDVAMFENALKASGYYAGKVDYRLVRAEARSERKTRPEVVFDIEAGPLFTVVEHKIVYDGPEETKSSDLYVPPDSFAALGLTIDARSDGASLQANQQAFLSALWENGYPAARMRGRVAEADMTAGTAVVTYQFNSGARAVFGEAVVTGLTRTREDYVQKLINWNVGGVYEKSKTIAYRDTLSETGLFDDIDIAPGPTPADGVTPILVSLRERKRRTIGAGVSFSTSEGPGVRVFYENRNLLGRGEQARVDLEASQIEQSARFILQKPLASLPGTAFLQGSLVNETTDAFDALSINLAGGLSKFWFDRKLEARGGIALETSNISPANGDPDERTFFVSLPLAVNWNNEDDFLNPTKGARGSVTITPYTGTQTFTQVDANARTRIAFGDQKKFVTAFRARLGATVGVDFDNLPLNQRFFSGGGGSVRGYGFQQVGPLEVTLDDVDEVISIVPTGGRSVIEGGIETRYSVTDTIQVAAFSDVGSVSAQALPDFSEEFFVGVGGGVRYITPVGPLRVDVAFPLTRRPTDNGFQFLISLGQAF